MTLSARAGARCGNRGTARLQAELWPELESICVRLREPAEASDVGASSVPTDLTPIGNSAGYSPEPPPTSTELPNGVGPVSRSLRGVLDAVDLITWEAGKFPLLNTATLRGYATFQLWGGILQGYMEMGPVGAINAVNPLYHIGKGGVQTYQHAERGDYRAATCAGVLTGVTLAATILGVVGGLASLAGKPPTAGMGVATEAGDVVARSVGAAESAFSVASRGGRHAGFLKQAQRWSVTQLQRAERHLQAQIELHEAKIADPPRHAVDWATRSPEAKQGLIRHWEKEIHIFADQQSILQEAFRRLK